MSLALNGPHIQARSYRRGRSFKERRAVTLLVAHSAEGARTARDLGAFFHRATTGSSNAGIGQQGDYCTYVNYGDTSFANPPLSEEADTVELCGFARWSRAQWLAYPKMLETFAHWIAWRCAVRRIPIVKLSVAQLKAGKPGIVDHDDVSDAYHLSDHWDLGAHFPWDVVLPRAKQIAGVGAVKPPATVSVYVVRKGDTLSKIAAKFKTTVAVLAKANGIKDPDSIAVGQRIKVTAVKAPVKKTGVRGPFPLAKGHYFSTPASNRATHSGTNAQDREYIKMIQQDVGVTMDGYYGDETRSAVIDAQRRYGLRPDGVVGPITWARFAL